MGAVEMKSGDQGGIEQGERKKGGAVSSRMYTPQKIRVQRV